MELPRAELNQNDTHKKLIFDALLLLLITSIICVPFIHLRKCRMAWSTHEKAQQVNLRTRYTYKCGKLSE